MRTKSEIRSEILAVRNSINLSEHQIRSKRISEKIINYIIDQKIESIHSYIAINNEVNTNLIIQYCLDNQVLVIVPKIENDRQLSHWVLNSLETLEKGLFSTLHPPQIKQAKEQANLILIPGVAFDKTKNRIGYGAGFYDRFLSETSASYKLGLAFDLQIIEKIEVDSHDIQLDAVVTESTWL